MWEPNYPVNNFTQNNGGKSRHQPDNNQGKVVTNDNTGQKYTVKGLIDCPCPIRTVVGDKYQTRVFLRPLNYNPHSQEDTFKLIKD